MVGGSKQGSGCAFIFGKNKIEKIRKRRSCRYIGLIFSLYRRTKLGFPKDSLPNKKCMVISFGKTNELNA